MTIPPRGQPARPNRRDHLMRQSAYTLPPAMLASLVVSAVVLAVVAVAHTHLR